MTDLFKSVAVVIGFGWWAWTGATLLISHIFNTDFSITYIVTGGIYALILFLIMIYLEHK